MTLLYGTPDDKIHTGHIINQHIMMMSHKNAPPSINLLPSFINKSQEDLSAQALFLNVDLA